MQFDWLLSPITQCVFLALTLIGCLALFISIKFEIAVVRCSVNKSRDSAAVSAATQASELATLRKEVESPDFPVGQELNLTRRAQALRMQHRGETPATIAAALRVPRNEVELLLKIQRLANGNGV